MCLSDKMFLVKFDCINLNAHASCYISPILHKFDGLDTPKTSRQLQE